MMKCHIFLSVSCAMKAPAYEPKALRYEAALKSLFYVAPYTKGPRCITEEGGDVERLHLSLTRAFVMLPAVHD